MAESSARGRFVWHELNSTDPAGAAKFYKAVVGWGTMPFAGNPSYVMWTAKGTPLGGVLPLAEEARKMGAPSHWLPYIAAPDVDETVIQAAAMGAQTYVPPMDVPGVGRFAVMADPQGAVFAPYRASGEWPGHDGPAEIGEFSWHELLTTDWEAALRFYQALFGWQRTDSLDMGAAGTYQMYGRNGETLGGMYTKPAEMPGPASWLCYARVPSADKSAEMATRHGGRIIVPPMEIPGGDRITIGMDPQGAAFAVHSVKVAAPAPTVRAAAKKSNAKKAAPKKVAAKKPVSKKPAAKKPAAKKPAAKKPAAKKPAAKKAVAKASSRKPERKPARRPARKSARKKAAARKRAVTRSRGKVASKRRGVTARRKPAAKSRRSSQRSVTARRTRVTARHKRVARPKAKRNARRPSRKK